MVGGRTPTEQRVALGANDGRRARRADPHRHRGDDDAQQSAPSSSPSRRAISTPRTASGWSRRSPTSTCWPTPSCARPASRSAPSRWNARSTSWPHEMGIDPIELRRRYEPEKDPTPAIAHSRRAHLVEGLCRRRGALRLGRARCRARARHARRRVAGRHGRAPPAPIPTTACPAVTARDHARRRRPARSSTAGHEMGMGTADGAGPARGRPAGRAAGERCVRVRRHRPAGRRHGRRLVADGGHRGGGDARRPACPARPGAEARRQRQSLGRPSKTSEVVARDGGLGHRRGPGRHERLRLDPASGPSAMSSSRGDGVDAAGA